MRDEPFPNRRLVIAGGSAVFAPVAAAGQSTPPRPPLSASRFLDAIGVNAHGGYVNTQYRDLGAVRDALRHIGVSRVRDGSPKPETAGRYRELAAAGVSYAMFWGLKQTMAEALGHVAALEAAVPGSVHAIEGPNEIRRAYAYGTDTGNAAAQRFMQDLRAAVQADPVLRRTPLYSFTSYERAASDCDFANHHPYPKAGKQPGELLRSVRDRYVGPHGVMPGKPMVMTEFGYHTLVGKPGRAGTWQGVTPDLQATLIVNGLLDNAAQGVARTYVYQLFDERPDAPGAPDQEKHFGLFDLAGAPKPAAAALRTLSQVLSEGRSQALAPALRRPAASLAAAPPLSALELAKADGSRIFAVWNESPVWNADLGAPLDVAAETATLTLDRPAQVHVTDVIDPRRSKTFGRVSRATIAVGSAPVLVQVG